MYTLFVADDESLVLDSITQVIDWKENGIEVVGVAQDGETALAEVLRLKPHVVLTDIRMPGMGGLELIQEVRKAGLSTVCIIMSGYTEFEYAKKAIELQANDYLIKPVELDVIKDTVLKATDKYRDIENQKKKDVQLHRYEKYLREKLIYQHILGTHTVSEEDVNVNLTGEYLVAVGKMRMNHHTCEADFSRLMGNVRTFAEENGCNTYLFVRDEQVILCQQCSESNDEQLFMQLMNRLSDESHVMRLGIALTPSPIGRLHDSYNKANEACDTAMFLNLPPYRYEHCGEVPDYPLDECLWMENIDTFISYCLESKCKPQFVHRNVNRWIQCMIGYMEREYDIGLSDFIGSAYNMQEVIRSLPTLEAIASQLKVWVDLCRQLIKMREASYKEKLISDVKYYIHQHYNDSQLTLDVLAKHFKMSVSHLSQLFSRTEGDSIYEFMIKKRIGKSKELLANSHIKISDIAVMTGYDNQRYFSQVFRKREGLTPGQYRSKHFVQQTISLTIPGQ